MFKQLLLIAVIIPLSMTCLSSQKSIQKRIYFEDNQPIFDENDEAILYGLIDTLPNFDTFSINLFGSADATVLPFASKKLSQLRVKAVMDYFIKAGISKDKISIAIESSDNIKAAQLSEKEKQLTRNVEIVVQYTELDTPSVSDISEPKKQDESASNSYLTSELEGDNGIKNSDLQKVYESIADKPTTQILKVSKNRMTKIMGDKGTILLLPPNTFDMPDSSEITFSVREAYSVSDMVTENLTTQSGNQILASGGMVKITAIYNGKEIQPQKSVTLLMPKDNSEKMKDSMQLFNGQRDSTGNLNWLSPPNGGFQLFQNQYIANYEEKINYYFNLKKIYRFMTDTCGCDKMLVWKMPKYTWKNQKKLFKEGKITELPPRYLTSNTKPPKYDFYKISTRNKKALVECGDTLSNFCKIIAKSNAPKIFTWQDRHRFVNEWKLNEKRGSLIQRQKTYRQYKVKTYYQYLAALHKEIDSTQQSLVYLGFLKSQLDTLSLKGYSEIREKLQKELFEKRKVIMESLLENKTNKDANDMYDLANYYIYETSSFGWVNCDYFMKVRKNKLVDVKTQSPDDVRINSKLIFKDLKIICSSSYDESEITFRSVKKEEKAVVVSIKAENNKAYLAMQPIVTNNKRVALQYEEITPQLLKEKLKTLDKYQIKLFPNPVNDVLTVQANTTFDRIQVVNMSGQTVLEDKNIGRMEHSINVSQLSNNTYFVRILEGNILRGIEKCVVSH